MTDDVTKEELKELLRSFVAMERDRLLGYPGDELHADPHAEVERAVAVLERCGDDPDEIIWPEDQEALGLDV